MKPILKWQYQQLTKELLLLQGHLADATCPCESEGEACVRKHLLTLEALATETMAIEDDAKRNEKLAEFALEARDLRQTEEQNLCGKEPKYPQDPLEWSRRRRKEFEFMCLVCETGNPGGGRGNRTEPMGFIIAKHKTRGPYVVKSAASGVILRAHLRSKAEAQEAIRSGETGIVAEYSNPHRPKAKSVVCRVGSSRCEVHFVASSTMAKGSLRTVKPEGRPDVDVLIGCPRGKYKQGRCTVATKLVMMRLPKEEAKAYGKISGNPNNPGNPSDVTRAPVLAVGTGDDRQGYYGEVVYEGELTTEHSQSSHGQPVLVIDGKAYGWKDHLPGMLAWPYLHKAEGTTQEQLEWLQELACQAAASPAYKHYYFGSSLKPADYRERAERYAKHKIAWA